MGVRILNKKNINLNAQRRLFLFDLGLKTANKIKDSINELRTTSASYNSVRPEINNNSVDVVGLGYTWISAETGRKPGRVNPEALERWAKLKLGNKKLAYAVAKSIAKKGTVQYRKGGRPKRISNAVEESVNRNLNRAVDKFLYNII